MCVVLDQPLSDWDLWYLELGEHWGSYQMSLTLLTHQLQLHSAGRSRGERIRGQGKCVCQSYDTTVSTVYPPHVTQEIILAHGRCLRSGCCFSLFGTHWHEVWGCSYWHMKYFQLFVDWWQWSLPPFGVSCYIESHISKWLDNNWHTGRCHFTSMTSCLSNSPFH